MQGLRVLARGEGCVAGVPASCLMIAFHCIPGAASVRGNWPGEAKSFVQKTLRKISGTPDNRPVLLKSNVQILAKSQIRLGLEP